MYIFCKQITTVALIFARNKSLIVIVNKERNGTVINFFLAPLSASYHYSFNSHFQNIVKELQQGAKDILSLLLCHRSSRDESNCNMSYICQ